jgi:hypothetical protein
MDLMENMDNWTSHFFPWSMPSMLSILSMSSTRGQQLTRKLPFQDYTN